jgi:hypothetical protein
MATPSSSSTTRTPSPPTSTQPIRPPQTPIIENIRSEKIEKEIFTLTPYEPTKDFLQCPRQLGPVTWSLNHLLHKLCSYFSRMFNGTKVQLTSGTFYIAGKNHWQECIKEKLHTETFEHPTGTEAWSFCTQPPDYFEIYFCLPRKISHEEFDRLIDLCLYFIASEVKENELSDIAADLNEFGLLIGQPESVEEGERLERMAIMVKEMRTLVARTQVTCDPPFSLLSPDELAEEKKRLGTIAAKIKTIKALVSIIENTCEIPLFDKSRLRLIFTLSIPEQREPFSLHLFPTAEGLSAELLYEVSPLKLLADIAEKRLVAPGKDRLLAYAFNHPQFFSPPPLNEKEIEELSSLGQFLYRYAFLPRSNMKEAADVLTLVGFLQTCLFPNASEAPCCQLGQDHLEITWKCGSATLQLRVPAYSENSLNRVCDALRQNKNCLTEALNLFFPRSLLTLRRQAAPQALPQAVKIYETLRGDSSAFVWFLTSCAAGWKQIEAEDLLFLPDWLSSCTKDTELNVALSNLELIFRTTAFEQLFDKIKKKLEVLKELSPEAIRLVCLRRLITCHEAKILPLAWQMWSQSLPLLTQERSFTLMIEISQSIRLETIPFAVPRVCALCHPEKTTLDPVQRMQLLVSYLERLLGLPLNDQKLIGYGPALVDPIEALLAADPTLESRLNSYPRVQNYLRPSTPDPTTPEPEVEEIRDKNWDYVQKRQERKIRKEFNKTFNRMTQALRANGAKLQKRKGFFQVLKWIVEVLLEKKDYENILSLLKYVTVKKTEHFYPHTMQECLSHLMKEKLPFEKFILYAAQFRESEVHPYVSQEFLLKFFIFLVRNAHTGNKLKESAVRKEIKFLHDLIKPEGKSANDFAQCLLLYYPTLVDEQFALQLIKDVMAHYQLLKDHLEMVVTPLFCRLKKSPKDTNLWDKFSKLVDKLKSNPEYVLALYESLTEATFLAKASVMDPPLQMIRKGITSFEKTLTDAQKIRLAKVLAALLALAQKEKKESELIRSFASIETLLGYLEKTETLPTFARLILDFARRRKVDPHTYESFCPSMLSISAHALADEKMVGDFRTVVLGIPLKDFRAAAAKWKKVIAGIVSRASMSPSSLELIKTLTELSSDAEEKLFFQMGRGLYEDRNYPVLKSSMETYYITGAPPKPVEITGRTEKSLPAAPRSVGPVASPGAILRPAVAAPPKAVAASPQRKEAIRAEAILSGSLSPAGPVASPEAILRPAAAAPPKAVAASPQGKVRIDYRSRAEAILSGSPSLADLDKALVLLKLCPGDEFELWEKLFSLLTPKSPDLYVRVWKAWIEKRPSGKARQEDSRYWEVAEHFLSYHLAVLVDCLPAESCEPICRVCFEIGINTCWNTSSAESLTILSALFSLSDSSSFKTKIGELHGLLTHETRVRFFLLLARFGDAPMQEVGQDRFLSMARAHGIPSNPAFDGNMVLFQHFCTLPYMPRHEKKQEVLHEWIESSWVALKSTLTWEQALSLIEVLCEFTYPAYSVDLLLVKWDEVVMGSWESKPQVSRVLQITSPHFAHQISVQQIQSPRPIKPLSNATRKLMLKLLGPKMDDKKKCTFLMVVQISLGHFAQRYYSRQLPAGLASLLLFLAKCSFDNLHAILADTNCKTVFLHATSNVLTCLPVLSEVWTSDCIESTESFISFLPLIMQAGMQTPNLADKVLKVIDLYMETPQIRNADPGVLHSWTQLLISLCTSVVLTKLPLRKTIAQAAVKVFTCCTHRSHVARKAMIPAAEQTQLINYSSVVLCLKFLTLVNFDCLDPLDWQHLFQGFSEAQLQEMLEDLKSDLDKTPLNHIGIARIFRYAPVLQPQVLSSFLPFLGQKLPILGSDKLSLRIRYFYIHAATSFLKTGDSSLVYKLREQLIRDFIQAFFKGVNRENYEKFKKVFLTFLEGIDDVVVVEKLKKAYILPEERNSMREELLEIPIIHIEKQLKALRNR